MDGSNPPSGAMLGQIAPYAFHEFMKVLRALKLTKFKEYGLAGVKLHSKYLMGGPLDYRRRLRKPRTTSKDMCEPCGNVHCDPMWPDTPAKKKIQKRFKADLCTGCGNKPAECRCRRKRR